MADPNADEHRAALEFLQGIPPAQPLPASSGVSPLPPLPPRVTEHPEVFQAVTKSVETPVMHKGSIKGFRMKMWGIYPTLVPETEAEAAVGAKITGTWYMVDSHVRFLGLQEYETHKYMLLDCTIFTEDGSELNDSGPFGWSGNPDSGELEDGVFDLERHQKYFKQSMVRPRPSV